MISATKDAKNTKMKENAFAPFTFFAAKNLHALHVLHG